MGQSTWGHSTSKHASENPPPLCPRCGLRECHPTPVYWQEHRRTRCRHSRTFYPRHCPQGWCARWHPLGRGSIHCLCSHQRGLRQAVSFYPRSSAGACQCEGAGCCSRVPRRVRAAVFSNYLTDGETIKTVEGQNVTVSIYNGRVFINNALVTT